MKNLNLSTNLILGFLLFASQGFSQWKSHQNSFSTFVNDITYFPADSSYYLVGAFDQPHGNMVKWDGNNTFDSVASFDYSPVVIERHNNKLFVGGGFLEINGTPIEMAATYDGANWGDLNYSGFSGISEFHWYQGKMYVGTVAGAFVFDTLSQIWSTINVQGNTTYPSIHGFTTYNGNLIAYGNFNSVEGVTSNQIIRFDGSNWNPYNISNQINITSAYAALGKLWVGFQYLNNGGSVDSAAIGLILNGGLIAHTTVQQSGFSYSPSVESIVSFKDTLYAGGTFDLVNNQTTKNYLMIINSQVDLDDSTMSGPCTFKITNEKLFAITNTGFGGSVQLLERSGTPELVSVNAKPTTSESKIEYSVMGGEILFGGNTPKTYQVFNSTGALIQSGSVNSSLKLNSHGIVFVRIQEKNKLHTIKLLRN